MLENVLSLLLEMKTLTISSGIKEKKYEKLTVSAGVLLADDLKILYCWLRETRDNQYQGVLEIKRLLPDEIWERYIQWGEEGLREQILLENTQKVLRKRWSSVPKAQPKKRKRSTDGVSVQSENAKSDGSSPGSK